MKEEGVSSDEGIRMDNKQKVVLSSMPGCFTQNGALLTAGVLTAGLISFRRGNSQLGQMLMRARVVAQGGTVALMVGTAYHYGENPWRTS